MSKAKGERDKCVIRKLVGRKHSATDMEDVHQILIFCKRGSMLKEIPKKIADNHWVIEYSHTTEDNQEAYRATPSQVSGFEVFASLKSMGYREV